VTPNKTTNIIFYLISIFFIAAVIWSMNSEVDQVVRAEAVVEPLGKVQVVQNRYPGSIKKFNAKVGDHVTSGDILYWLNREESDSAIEQNRITFFNAKAEMIRYKSEAYGHKMTFPAGIPPQFINQQTSIYTAKVRSLNEQLHIIAQEIEGKENAILQANAGKRSAQENLLLIIEERDIYEPLVREGIEPKIRLLSLDRQAQESKSVIEQQSLIQKSLVIEIETLERRKNQVTMEFQVQAKERLAESTNIANKANAEYTSLQEKLSMTEVKSPVDGIISATYVTTEGAVVNGGDTLAEIVPISDTYRVLAKVQPADISLVSLGQACKVSFTAYDFAIYGSIEGKIINIAQNITETNQGVMYYEVWVETTTNSFSKTDIIPKVMPGMVAQVDILGDKTRVIDYILNPLKRTASIALTEQ
jgi:adhesin transport system membrane fusion protein